ncbi:MAG TPA: tRNA pseudouridine(38-40) synthase TruA [Thermoanaerobaculia bacterium]
MPTYQLTIEYEGTRYSGWQAQGNTQKTVQGHLIRAAEELLGEVDIGGAGRTDAGVHAAAQIAHLRTRKSLDEGAITRGLNDRLPHDINVLDTVRASDGFHSRHDATSRVYLYQIATRRTAFAKPFVWWIKDRLDLEGMQAAAALVAGRHDFGAFTDKRLPADDSRIVVVERCDVVAHGELILVRIAASHFLWKMVRKLISFFVEVGRGNAGAGELDAMLRDGGPLYSPTAPPSGLFLESVLYPGQSFDRPLVPLIPVEAAPPRALMATGTRRPVQRPRKGRR